MPRRKLVVAIDGPSGSGKSTVAREVASALGLRYLDTGAMYRAVTWLALHDGVELGDAGGLGRLARGAQLEITTDPRVPRILAAGQDLSETVRSPEVTAAVSTVSAVPEVRAAMVERQRQIIDDGGIVVEGRDIGTTVVPDAPVKVFLTADAATRAQRRTRQDGRGDIPDSVGQTEADLARRDTADATRAASPLQQPPDAIVIDSSELPVAAVVARILDAAAAVAP